MPEPFPQDPQEVAFTLLEAWSAEELMSRLSARFRLQRGATVERREVFVDTPDWRLLRARMTLARRGTGRQSELHLTDGNGTSERLALRKPPEFAWELPEGSLRKAIARTVSVRRLVAHADTELEIITLEVIDEREKIVVRVHLTRGRASAGAIAGSPGRAGSKPRHQQLPTTLRVEPLRGYASERDAVVEFLGSDPSLVVDRDTALTRALRVLGRDPEAERLPWRVELDPRAPAGVEVRRVLARFAEIMRANEAGILADVDTEFLHDFRVAVRRTRSILSQSKHILSPDELEHYKGEFAWLGKCTSPVRDLDVFLLAAHGRAGSLGGADPEGLEPLRRLLTRRRSAAAKHLFEVLRSSRYHYAMESWAAFLEVPSSADPTDAPGGGALAPVRDFAAERIRRQHKRVLKRGRKLKQDSPAEELHDLRIECKKLRYLVDAFGGLFPLQAGARLVQRLKRLQSVLGDYNDAQVQSAMLLELATELGQPQRKTPPLLIVELGRAVERLARQAAELRPKAHERERVFQREQGADAIDELLGGRLGGGLGGRLGGGKE